ncbi:MAG: hypothetical protein ACJ76H_03485 [Bacteriovoracaceae bacterium]
MKYFPLVFIFVSGLSGCSSSSPQKNLSQEKLKALQEEDNRIIETIHEEPLRQGRKTTQTENGITSEIWKWKEDHGSPFEQTEELLYKNGELISRTFSDPQSAYKGSIQYKDGKVIQLTEEKKNQVTVIIFDELERLKGRMNYPGKECLLYHEGANPHGEDFAKCEAMFNTAP